MKTFKVEYRVPATVVETFYITAEDAEIANQKGLSYYYKEMDQDGEYQKPVDFTIETDESDIEVDIEEIKST